MIFLQEKLTDFKDVNFNLFSFGAQLNDETLVGDLSTDTLELNVPLLGGKVHGSLARAGKVKGQTPKVIFQSFKFFLIRIEYT